MLTIGSFGGAAATPTDPDSYTALPEANLITAFGTRRIIESYISGPILRFRDGTGGTEYDVAQDSLGYCDVAAALASLGLDPAYIVREYGQGGSAYDGYWTSSTAPQPRLLISSGGRKNVAISHVTNNYMQCDMPITAGMQHTIYFAWTPFEMAGAMVMCGGTGSTFKWWINTDSLNRLYLFDGSANPVTPNYSVIPRMRQVLAVEFATNALKVYVNGQLVLSHGTWNIQASNMFQIARRVDGGGSIGSFNHTGFAAYTGAYSPTINAKMMNIFC